VYFNQKFNVSAIQMRRLGVFNLEIGTDNKMFVDSKLLESAQDEFAGAHSQLLSYFAKTVDLIKLSKKPGDLPWQSACARMQFKEISHTGLGCSSKGTDGNGIGKVLAEKIVQRAADILPHVGFQPDVFELIGVFAENLGCDRLSDMIVSILRGRFFAYTDRITRTLGVAQTAAFTIGDKTFVFPKLERKPLVLVPRAILKPLPVALDIEQALDNADLNAAVRAELNKMFADAQKHNAVPGRTRLREFIRTNPKILSQIIEGYQRAQGIPYDFDTDPHRVSDVEAVAQEIVGNPGIDTSAIPQEGRAMACLTTTLDHFEQAVQENGLSDCLFDDDGKPRKEVISQRLLFAVAGIFGKLYNVDVSREGNAGVGSVDFRFTVGYKDRLLVELKLSTHSRLKDGYYEQLPAYAKAEGIKQLVLLIIRISDDVSHIEKLLTAINEKELPIQVRIIDAMPRPSASKRHTSS
jgi:hypothetical protein